MFDLVHVSFTGNATLSFFWSVFVFFMLPVLKKLGSILVSACTCVCPFVRTYVRFVQAMVFILNI